MNLFQFPEYKHLETVFNSNGYELDVDLSNSIIVERDGDFVEYDDLPEDLREALDTFGSVIENVEEVG